MSIETAIGLAISHDDGHATQDLEAADVVLVGVGWLISKLPGPRTSTVTGAPESVPVVLGPTREATSSSVHGPPTEDKLTR